MTLAKRAQMLAKVKGAASQKCLGTTDLVLLLLLVFQKHDLPFIPDHENGAKWWQSLKNS